MSFHERTDLNDRLTALKKVIVSLRDCNLPPDSKKRMLNHAIWEITKALGDFAPEFRSKGVLRGEIGTKIERDHVYKRKQIVAEILANKPLRRVLQRIVHCVVTKKEHTQLTRVPNTVDGWLRYRYARIEVFQFRGKQPIRVKPWLWGLKKETEKRSAGLKK